MEGDRCLYRCCWGAWRAHCQIYWFCTVIITIKQSYRLALQLCTEAAKRTSEKLHLSCSAGFCRDMSTACSSDSHANNCSISSLSKCSTFFCKKVDTLAIVVQILAARQGSVCTKLEGSVWSQSQGTEGLLGEGPAGVVAVGMGVEGGYGAWVGRLIGPGGAQKL